MLGVARQAFGHLTASKERAPRRSLLHIPAALDRLDCLVHPFPPLKWDRRARLCEFLVPRLDQIKEGGTVSHNVRDLKQWHTHNGIRAAAGARRAVHEGRC